MCAAENLKSKVSSFLTLLLLKKENLFLITSSTVFPDRSLRDRGQQQQSLKFWSGSVNNSGN